MFKGGFLLLIVLYLRLPNGRRNPLTHYRPAMPFGTEKKLEDISCLVLSQFQKYQPPENLKFINLGIFHS